MIGGPSVLAAVMTIGLVATLPMLALSDVPADLDGTPLAMLVTAGTLNIVGLLLIYAALRVGKVSIVAPISSTEGAIAAVLAIVAGEQIGVGSGVVLAVVAVGIALAGMAEDDSHATARRGPVLALGAAVCFGVGLFVTGRLSDDMPLVWATLPARVIGVVAVAIPLLLAGRFRITRQAVPFVVAGGILEVIGFLSYAVGSRHGIAIAAVLASQFAAIAAIAAYYLFGERISRRQLVGIVVIAVGVALLSALQA